MEEKKFDLVIIGSGPGGYVAAIRAAQLNMNVAVIEKESLGGVCLNWGCIPSKAIIKSAEIYSEIKNAKEFGIIVESIDFDFSKIIKRSRKIAGWMSRGVDMLFKKNKIKVFEGTGRIESQDKVAVIDKDGNKKNEIKFNNLIIASGARPKLIKSFNIDGENVITYKDALKLEKLPESILIIGAGAIGMEFAYVYNTFGVKVYVVEMLPNILPLEDSEITEILEKTLRRKGIKFYTNTTVESVNIENNEVNVRIKSEKGEDSITVEKVLSAVGVNPNTEGLGLEEIGVKLENGFIKVNENYQTNLENIYAIGDVIGGMMLAHKASAEGIYTVEKLANLSPKKISSEDIPSCVYCHPQVASIGLTEKDAMDKGYRINKGIFPFKANGKSVAVGETTGIVKLIFNEENRGLLGGHIIGNDATELIAEVGMALGKKAINKDFINIIHSHPTASEAIMEAAAFSMGEAIHI